MGLAPGDIIFGDDLDRMGCSLRRVAAQALPDAALTVVSWDTEDADTDGLYPGSGTTITIPAGGGGIWSVFAQITVAANPPAGLGFVSIQLPGGNTHGIAPIVSNLGAPSVTVPLSAGALITVSAFADGAAATTMTGEIFAYRVSA